RSYQQDADHHHDRSVGHHFLPQRILKQIFPVAWIEEVHSDEHREWQPAQDPAGQPALRGANPELPSYTYALANHVRSLIEDLREITAGLLLNKNRGDQKLKIGDGHKATQVDHGLAKWL